MKRTKRAGYFSSNDRCNRKEIDRLDVVRRVLERRLTQVKAAEMLGLVARQVGRLCAAYERHGRPSLVSQPTSK